MTPGQEVFGLSGLPRLRPSDATNLAGQSDAEVGRGHISHSEIGELLSCKQKYSFKREQLIERIARSEAQTMGKAFQLGIEYEDPQVAFDSIYEGTRAYTPEAEATRQKQAVVVRAASTLYLSTYEKEPGSIREFDYRVRLRNPWTGRYSRTFDLLGYADELSGTFGCLTENKLVGQFNKLDIRRLPLDRQIALACYGVWRATGVEVKQVRKRWTRKPSIKQRQNEGLADYLERVEADYMARPEFYLHEEEIYRSTTDLVRVEAELWEWAEDIRAGRKRNVWARNTSVCGDFGGCEYLPICTGDPDAGALYQERVPLLHNSPTNDTKETHDSSAA